MKLQKLMFKEMVIPRITFLFMLLGFLIILIGVWMNFTAVLTNGGRMPVWINSEYESETHFAIKDINEVNNLQFADIYHIKRNIWSIGDFFILFGCLLLILSIFIMIQNSIVKVIFLRRIKNVRNNRIN